MLSKSRKYLWQFFYFLSRRKWNISFKDPSLEKKLDTYNYLLEEQEIESNEENKIWLFSEKKIKRGWYLFGILHFGENKNCISNLYYLPYFKQGRPTFPSRRRWRVIRHNKKTNLIIEINQITNSIKINEIWLIPIPLFFAWRKINRKILHFTSKKFINSIHKPYLWKSYNLIFKKQIKKHQKFSYEDWMKFVEKPLINNLEKNYSKKCNWSLLENLEQSDLTKIRWIIILKPHSKLSNNINLIINFLDKKDDNIEMAYGDEDHLSKYSQRIGHIFKPAWNRELFWADPFYSSHWIVSTKLFKKVFKEYKNCKNISFEKLVFRLIKYLSVRNRESNIKHIPLILSHRQNDFYNFYDNAFIKGYKINLYNHITEITSKQIKVKEDDSDPRNLFINWPLPKNNLLSVIIPTKDKLNILKKCIDSIYRYKAGCNLEIIILNNNSINKSTFDYLEEFSRKSTSKILTRVINYNHKFNYSKINNLGVEKALGDTILLLNNDVEFRSKGWGFHLSSNANRGDIGCVGAKLFFEDSTIQHAGVILGIGGVAGHSHKYFNSNSEGYCRRLNLIQEYSAVTAACLCITKSKWMKIGGLDEINLPVNYNDVDLCLRARKYNLKNIFLPQVKAIHLESKTRGKPQGDAYIEWRKEYKFMKKKWGNLLQSDLYYSPHLSNLEEDWSITINESKLFVR